MATHPPTGTTPVPPGLRLTHDLNDALTTWSTSQRTVIGLAADFADSGEWMATSAVSAAHWIAAVADIEVCTAREWIRVGRRLRALPVIADLFDADELSYSKVRTLSRIATPENEQQLAAIAADVPAGADERRMVLDRLTGSVRHAGHSGTGGVGGCRPRPALSDPRTQVPAAMRPRTRDRLRSLNSATPPH